MSLISLHIYLNSNKHTQKIVSKNNIMNNKNRYNRKKWYNTIYLLTLCNYKSHIYIEYITDSNNTAP